MYNPSEEGRPPDAPRFKHWSHPTSSYADNLNNNNNTIKTHQQQPPPPPPHQPTRLNRNSFHCNVEEALNSLLWQPYEYQNNRRTPPSSSTTSSCLSLSDLDEPPNKEDPNRNRPVNNRSSSLYAPHRHPLVSRAPIPNRPTSRLNGEAAIPTSSCEYLNSSTSSTIIPCNNNNNEPKNHQLTNKQCCAAEPDMQLEVTADHPSANTSSILNIDHNGLIHHHHHHHHHQNAIHGLQSANVVGLPPTPPHHHLRNASEPAVHPPSCVHLRSASVPKAMPKRAAAAEPRNVSNVNVNCYRAVPANVVTSVPTIRCQNTVADEPLHNVSSVRIMPLNHAPPPTTATTTQVTVHGPAAAQRTFTSTEAQTDAIVAVSAPAGQQAERRRVRRERRHQKRAHNHRHQSGGGGAATSGQSERLPDLLNSHMPPPYVQGQVMVAAPVPPPPQVLQSVVPSAVFAAPPPLGQVPLVGAGGPPPTGFRFPFPAGGFRRGRFSEEPPKGCCGLLSWKPGSLRWFIAVIALVAVCCVLVGTALGAMRPAGRDHLTVSLLMIGVGIVLVTVSGVAWRLTSHDSSTCRSMLGLGSTESVDVCTRRFVPRLPPSYGRPHHPYAAMMYPEFQYRPPPPSYQASMQEYRLRLLLLDRGNTPQMQNSVQNAVSPPPTYRSHAGSLLRAPLSNRRDATQSEYSCPPSYRSQNSTVVRRSTPMHPNSLLHSREHSLSLSESNSTDAVVNVVNILASTDENDLGMDNITLDSLKLEPSDGDLNQLRLLLKGESHGELDGMKDGNLVTIVQTSDQSPVIVTVSGSSQIDGGTVQISDMPNEMEILAHL